MGQRSGLGLVEVTVLEALDFLGARFDHWHIKCAKVVAAVDESIGLAPGYGHEVLCDLARPWTVAVRLVDFHGNYGSQDYPAAGPRYVESRLSPAGEVALAAERRELAPVPIGLINGNTYRGGTRPPFRPHGIIAAAHRVITDPRAADADLISIIGPPDFLTGCAVEGDLKMLAEGRPTELRLEARVSVMENGSVVIENIPPNAGPRIVSESIANRQQPNEWADDYPSLDEETRLPLASVDDLSSGTDDRLVCMPEPGVPPEVLRNQLMGVYGISTTVPVALPGPLATLVRDWVDLHRDEDLVASLDASTPPSPDSPAANRQVGSLRWCATVGMSSPSCKRAASLSPMSTTTPSSPSWPTARRQC